MRGLLILFLLSTTVVFGQSQKPKNFSKFDTKMFRFGMSLGGNSYDFIVLQQEDAYNV
jgi:hypothetical protein